jgi:hypothetical protein
LLDQDPIRILVFPDPHLPQDRIHLSLQIGELQKVAVILVE